MDQATQSLGLKVRLKSDYATAKTQVLDVLKDEGFGVNTEVNIKASMKRKLNIDFREYTILGVCTSTLAQRALTTVPDVGLFLPCNVTISEVAGEDAIEVVCINMRKLKTLFNSEKFDAFAEEAHAKFVRVVAALEE
jgi:uncharacterized protein (DUF302 family)